MAYLDDGISVSLTDQAESADNVLGLSDMGPYANEIRYFTDCVLAGKNADKVKPQELATVINILDDFKSISSQLNEMATSDCSLKILLG